MNILHYTGMPTAQKFGGVEKWFVEFASLAKAKGHKTFISYTEEFPKNNVLSDAYKSAGLFPLITLKRDRSLLLKQIKENNIDIVFFHFVEPYEEPLFIKKRTSCKVYCFFHCYNYYSELRWFSNFRELLAASFYRWAIFKSQFFIDGYFPVSKAVKRQFITFCFLNPFKCHQIYLGIDRKKKIQLRHPNSRIIIGCVACHGSFKGIDILIEAADILKHRDLNFEIWQIGGGMSFNNGVDTDLLHKFAVKKGISDCFKWLGVRNDVEDLMKQMDIYVQPSRREAISLTIGEAMMCGLPIVASNVDGIPEYIDNGKNGFLYNDNDPKLLADSLQILIEHEDLRISMGQRSYDIITSDRFNRSKNIKRIIDKFIK